jgi:hypothetical protein
MFCCTQFSLSSRNWDWFEFIHHEEGTSLYYFKGLRYQGDSLCIITYGSQKYRNNLFIPSETNSLKKVVGIDNWTCKECTNLKKVTISNSIKFIGNSAFYGCTSLESLVIPESVKTIGDSAFMSCSILKEIQFPAGRDSISFGKRVIRNCDALQTMTLFNSMPPVLSTNNSFTNAQYANLKILVPRTALEAYQSDANWSKFANIIPLTYSFQENGIFYEIKNDNEVSVSYDNSTLNIYKGHVAIPESVTHDGITYQVTSIGLDAFKGCTLLTSVSIPNTVTAIDENAFFGCSSLKSITIPNSVVSIGYSAFSQSGLTSLDLGTSLQYIGKNAFADCYGLTQLYIPSSLSLIDNEAFKGCNNLKEITLSPDLTEVTINDGAFDGCDSLFKITCLAYNPPILSTNTGFTDDQFANVKIIVLRTALEAYQSDANWSKFANILPLTYSFQENGIFYEIKNDNEVSVSYDSSISNIYNGHVAIPESVTHDGNTYQVTSIGSDAFKGCTSLTSVSIPNSVTVIDESAFFGCSSLKSISIPNSVVSIGCSAFSQSGLTFLDLGTSLQYIGKNAFADCYGLTQLHIPSSLNLIDCEAFKDCYYLKEITLDKDVTELTLYAGAFDGCDALATITCLPPNPPLLDNRQDGFNDAILNRTILQVPHSRLSVYQEADEWLRFANIQSLDYDLVLNGIYFLRTSNEDASVVSKDNKRNSYRGDVVIPEMVNFDGEDLKVTAIANSAFQNCSNLTSVTMPNSITTIGGWAFAKSGIKNIDIPNSVTKIGPYAFAESSLNIITLSNNITEIKNGTFCACSLNSITIPNKVTCIGDSAFFMCRNLKSIAIPNSVTRIGLMSFTYASLGSVNIPNSVTEIGTMAFAASDLRSVTLPDSITILDDGIFSLCTDLVDIVIPNSVKEIKTEAFTHCWALKKMVIPNSVERIGAMAFYWCIHLDTLVIGSGIKNIGDWAFNSPGIPGPGGDGFFNSIESITCFAPTPASMIADAFESSYSTAKLTVPHGSLEKYRNAEGWKRFAKIVTDIPYDINDDGEINIVDLNVIINAIINDTSTINPILDVNENGEINIADINAIINLIIGYQ